MDTRFRHNFIMCLAGQTMSGKTEFLKRFLTHLPALCDVHFDRILLYYGEWQPTYQTDFKSGGGQAIEFREGLPQPSDYSNDNHNKKLVILDDLMRESSNSTILDMFTKGCHHKNMSLIFITQNIFHKGSHQRDMSLNYNYLVLFRNVRDRSQIMHLARQIWPSDTKFVREAYTDACAKPYSYLVVDLKQDTPDDIRFRACIFPDDEMQYAYVPKFR